MTHLEKQRLKLLSDLDAAKTRQERNRLGQFATPPRVADEIVAYALQESCVRGIRYLEPGFGTGAFLTSLLGQVDVDTVDGRRMLDQVRGYEVDSHYANPSAELYQSVSLDLRVEDFTEAKPEPFDLILCNPPYVRHHHMESPKKVALAEQVAARYKIRPTGLTGLYNYFMMAGEAWLSDEGISAWLVPSEFLDVNYGVAVKTFLLKNVTLTRIHLYESEDLQFDDALVSSAVVWYRKGKPAADHHVEVSYGGSLLNPVHSRTVQHQALNPADKWTRLIRKGAQPPAQLRATERAGFTLKDFFDIKRGLATGDNQFFVFTEQQVNQHNIPQAVLSPILPSPRHLKTDVVASDAKGIPTNIDKLYLLNCRLTPEVLAQQHPTVWEYLKTGIGTVSEKYLCRSRKLWYLQEVREPAPLLCTYMGRGTKTSDTPFRFILNRSQAVATNSFLMLYPKAFWRGQAQRDPNLMQQVWEILSAITTEDLISEGRTYGGGLEKIEPSELGNVPIGALAGLLNHASMPLLEAA